MMHVSSYQQNLSNKTCVIVILHYVKEHSLQTLTEIDNSIKHVEQKKQCYGYNEYIPHRNTYEYQLRVFSSNISKIKHLRSTCHALMLIRTKQENERDLDLGSIECIKNGRGTAQVILAYGESGLQNRGFFQTALTYIPTKGRPRMVERMIQIV